MSKKILVIDDEIELLEMLKVRLEANQYEVITASDGVAGLQQWKNENPDLILLDVVMPNMDGYTFLREAFQDDGIPKSPVIVLTSKSGMKDLFEIEGVKDYIVKPFDDAELLSKIKFILEQAE